jgi:hypothetical protein
MRLQLGDAVLEVTEEQAADLRRQLGVADVFGSGTMLDTAAAAPKFGPPRCW